MTYFIVLLLFIFLSIKYANNNLYNKKMFCIYASLIILFLLVLRNDYVGTDTQNYRFVYDNILNPGYYKTDEFEISSEIGFYSLLYVMQTLALDFRLLLFLSALLYVTAVSFIIYKYSDNPFFSYFLFFVNGLFIFNTTMRHCFALSFFIFAIYFAINRRLIPYLIFIAMAILFHSSAVVILPIYWLLNLKLNKKLYIIIAISFVVMTFFSTTLMPYIGSVFGKKYDIIDTGGVFRTLLNMTIAMFGICNIKRLNSTNRFWILFLLFSIVLTPIAKLHPAFFRIYIYLTFFLVLLIPNLSNIKTTNIQILIVFIVCFGLLDFTYLSKMAGIRVFPYVFYWENYYEENPEARALKLL